jgi:hypothetical protein
VLIYVEFITERLLYTLNFVLRDREVQFRLTNDSTYFKNAIEPKFNYSNTEFEGALQIRPATLLFDDQLYRETPQIGEFHQTDCLQFDNIADLLASVFYVLSRMEEYNSTQRDHLDRFMARGSLLSKAGWLQTPICDIWSEAFITFLNNQLQVDLKAKKPAFHFQPTFDIDNTFAFAHKNKLRSFLAQTKDLFYQRKERAQDRRKVRSGLATDPYDTFDTIANIAIQYPQTKVFWLLGNYTSKDKNLSHLNEAQQAKIKKIAAETEIGIHLSSITALDFKQMQIECERLAQITGQTTLSNRQHYLMHTLPQTYLLLLKAGIRHDYTMGYAEQTGFRAGTARTFPWFNLLKNEVTELNIHPFMYMDGTLKEYLELTNDAAKQRIRDLYKEVKRFGGTFSFLWHNETIGGYQQWADYQEVFYENFKLYEQ